MTEHNAPAELLSHLRPEVRAWIETNLSTLAATLAPNLRSSVIDDLRADVAERLGGDATVADAQRLMAALGSLDAEGAAPSAWERLAHGFDPHGIGERIARTWWAPTNPQLFLPRAVGWGWDLNLGAVAVRLGLIEPDAEAVPFESTRPKAFGWAAAVPATLAAAVVAHYLVRGATLPDPLPAHWGLNGRADRWTAKRSAAVTDLATTLLPAAAGGWAATSGRPGPQQAGTIALAATVATAGAATTVWRSLPDRPRWWAGPGMAVAAIGAAGVVLLGLARDGRSAEVARDLGRS